MDEYNVLPIASNRKEHSIKPAGPRAKIDPLQAFLTVQVSCIESERKEMRSKIDSTWTCQRIVPILATTMSTVIRETIMAITIVEMKAENLKMEEQIMFIVFNVFRIADSKEERYLQEL